MTPEKELRGRAALARILAILALIGALICTYHVYTAPGWQAYAFGLATGCLVAITVNRIIAASVYTATLVVGQTIDAVMPEIVKAARR